MRFKLVFALGNPEDRYHSTYHNVGMIALSYLQNHLDGCSSVASRSSFSYFTYNGVFFVFSGVSMNLSGKAASDALSYFKIPSTELLIVHDDSDLSIGTYKLAYDRGAGGHHGVESIVDHLNTQSFWRGRIGIRPETAPSLPRPKAGDFVLHPIRPSDIEIFSRVFDSFWKEVGFDLI